MNLANDEYYGGYSWFRWCCGQRMRKIMKWVGRTPPCSTHGKDRYTCEWWVCECCDYRRWNVPDYV